MLWFFESQEDPPPLPARSAVFVMRNGRYEPQNLMPMLPRPDILDFDGFVARRGAAAGYMNARPPEMRQASLVKNPVSIRRSSLRAHGGPSILNKKVEMAPEEEHPDLDASEGKTDMGEDSLCDRTVSFGMVFDAMRAGTLTVHLLVTEVEQSSKPEKGAERCISLVPRAPPLPEGLVDEQAQGGLNVAESLLPAAPLPAPKWATQLGRVLDKKSFEAGLDQSYNSPPIDLSCVPAEMLAYDQGCPRDIPIAICLEPEEVEGEEVSTHYTYVSLQKQSSSPGVDTDAGVRYPQWSSQVFLQKLQYGGNCFVLHEVFGVASKQALDTEVEGGNSDCVICLSEPRDTAVLPCRHMCFCSYCAGIVRLQCDRCPVCRQKVQSLLQFKRERDASTEELMGLKPPEEAPLGSARSMAGASMSTTKSSEPSAASSIH